MSFGLGFWAAAGSGAANSFELISTTILTGTASTITFSSIPTGTYKHLQLRWVARDLTNSGDFYFQFNGDGGSNYSGHRIVAGTSGISSNANVPTTVIYNGFAANSSDTTGAFSTGISDILDAFSTSKNKTVRSYSGVVSSNIFMGIRSGAWYNTSAVNQIVMIAGGGGFITGSRFSLYGIKG
jgi:hypothetical protein